MKRLVFCHAQLITLAILASVALSTSALAQETVPAQTEPRQEAKDSKAAEKKPEEKPAAKPRFTLTVRTTPILNISLKADKAVVSEVAQELSRKLKIPVFLGQERQKELLTIEFDQLTLEPALQLLAPTVYVDYEIDTGSLQHPKPLGIFLYDLNQGEPPLTAVVGGSTQSLLIEGNTEDGVESEEEEEDDAEEETLRINFQNNLLSVKAKKQPLPLVLLKIGEQLGIQVDIQQDSIAMVDVEISKSRVEDVMRQLSPNIRLFVRADVTRAENRALRLILAEPPKTTQ